MTSTVQGIARKRDGNQKVLETVLVELVKIAENLTRFAKKKWPNVVPKNIARTTDATTAI